MTNVKIRKIVRFCAKFSNHGQVEGEREKIRSIERKAGGGGGGGEKMLVGKREKMIEGWWWW